jgi:uncharacterized membrane protein YadS
MALWPDSTVYAVPQVIAAAAPMGAVAVQMGALAGLVRVLMLGPVCVVMALIAPGLGGTPAQSEPYRVPVPARSHVRLHHLVPWFIVGFLALVGLRSFDAVPHDLLAPMGQLASFLTVVSMAALGLGVEVRTIARAGGRLPWRSSSPPCARHDQPWPDPLAPSGLSLLF